VNARYGRLSSSSCAPLADPKEWPVFVKTLRCKLIGKCKQIRQPVYGRQLRTGILNDADLNRRK
jgi:hypothetical protein